MLAYSPDSMAQNANVNTSQLRHFLIHSVDALTGIADAVRKENLQPAERHEPFYSVLDRDAGDSLAAIEMVLAQSAISSQLIDNLNASIHLRAAYRSLSARRDRELHSSTAASESKVALGVDSANSLLESVPANDD